jgi:hypothetical protein
VNEPRLLHKVHEDHKDHRVTKTFIYRFVILVTLVIFALGSGSREAYDRFAREGTRDPAWGWRRRACQTRDASSDLSPHLNEPRLLHKVLEDHKDHQVTKASIYRFVILVTLVIFALGS